MANKPTKSSSRRAPAEQKPRGRPALAAEDRRDVLLRVLTTQTERDELQRAAEAAGAPVGTWARIVLLATARGA